MSSWWGKLIGGGVGYAIGGTLGAVIGTVFGHQIDKRATDLESDEDYSPGAQARVQAAFFSATFSVLGHLAKADGRVSEDEIAHARDVMDRLQLPEAQRQAAMALFTRGKADDFDIDSLIADLRREAGRRRHLLQLFMEFITECVVIDGDVHAEEMLRLQRIGRGLGFNAAELQRLLAAAQSSVRFEYARDRADPDGYRDRYHSDPLTDAYRVLEIDRSASDDELKKAYRRRMAQHHPDKLIAQGLPEEMIRAATRQTQAIREAYDAVRAARGLDS